METPEQLDSPVGRESGLQRELIDAGASTERRTREAGGVAVQALICGNVATAQHLIERPTLVEDRRWDCMQLQSALRSYFNIKLS